MKKGLLAGVVVLLGLVIAAGVHLFQKDSAQQSDFAGSSSCRECHGAFYERWETSLHGKTLQTYSPEFATEHLPARTFSTEIEGGRAEIHPHDGVLKIAANGASKDLKIKYAVGGKNVYYFLAELDRGRLQTIPVSYDVRKKEWFNTSASAIRHFSDGSVDAPLHWTHRAFTFTTSCYRCHVSQAETNYDVSSDSYRLTWAEPGINCETCHGPGAEHVQEFRRSNDNSSRDLKIISTTGFSVEQTNAMCAPCHAKMTPITEAFKPGEKYFDHYDLVTLEDQDFYPDGRDLGENYTYTSWLMSPCVQSGQLSCMHCHTSSGRFRFETNPDASCLPCHAEKVEQAETHTRHQQGTAGGRCIDCHMPATEFARMRRSDHSMLPPSPAATMKFGSPNACTLCHREKSAAWADALVKQWSNRDYQAPILLRAGLVDAARKREWSKLNDMLGFIRDTNNNDVVVSSLLRLLRGCDDERKWPAIMQALNSPSPLVRGAAAEALSGHTTEEALQALVKSAGDEYRLVRIRAAAVLSESRPGKLNQTQQLTVESSVNEYLASLRSRPDDFPSQYNLGNYYLARGEFENAVAHYAVASRLEPDDVAVRVNASLAYNASGRNREAEESLRKALAIQPMSTAANLNLGLLLAETGRLHEAEGALRAAVVSDSTNASAAYNLAVLVAETRLREAIALCERAVALEPNEEKYSSALQIYRMQAKQAR